MTTQFDALSQLFEQITERLIRIETKLDGKADLNTVGVLEARIRDLELTVAAKDALIKDLHGRVPSMEMTIRTLEDRFRERDAVHEHGSFVLDTWRKKLAAAAAVGSIVFSAGEAIWRLLGGG